MQRARPSGLPIETVLPELTAKLAGAAAVVLQAPPGAGKSTVVPLVLLECGWLHDRRIIMLEPRRLAARAVAARMARTLGEEVGRTVGHRMRMDTRVSRDTRIEVVTEGVLTRMLQQDAALEGVGLVIFDEFHERSLQADLGLALTLDAQANLAPELKVLVMSATLDIEAIATKLGHAPVVQSLGRSFPVATRYAGSAAPLLPGPFVPNSETLESLTTRIVRRALSEEAGDVLVFLPGMREIRRVQAQLQNGALPAGTQVLPLYGELRPEEQDAALAPAAQGARKVVLATNIAETSLTIEGIRIVVDSGLERRALFDPVTGMGRLETARISRASADQRQGRAGRLEPGVCYRAWSEGAQRSLAAFSAPEILQTDLAGLALELAAWGAIDAGTLTWLDPPPTATLTSARDLLGRLDALDEKGRVSAHGREMARLPLHPRLAHMLLAARPLGCVPLAADLAALLSERDLLRAAGAAGDADIRSRLSVLHGQSEPAGVERGALQRARRLARDLLRQSDSSGAALPASAGAAHSGLEGVLLALAYPDRIARKRPGGDNRFVLSNGRGAQFAQPQSLALREFIVAIDADDRDRDARITLAAPLSREDLEEHFSAHLRVTDEVHWDDREQIVVARRVTRLFELEIAERPLREVPPEAAAVAMLEGITKLGLGCLPWNEESRDLQARMEFVRAHAAAAVTADWPAVDEGTLSADPGSWLRPWLIGVTRLSHLARLSMSQILKGLLRHEQQLRLDELAPTHFTVPTGSRIRIDYRDELAPVVAVRLQEVFGVLASPRLAGGVPVTFKLLSPAQRPVQITRDLATFWRGSYAEVRKDMRGRYPRHYWPEDPAVAEPTRRAKPPGRVKP
ncbi:MAG TPA: ATP-dependent helicase HrpB [Steroidobacteraceae bacterium]|nr:ATP-dependent helicase HrpB [Steroidobacteraceae bacterium]